MIVFRFQLQAGGAPAIVWSWLLGGTGAMLLAISIAEIASAYPTSGGMYFTLKYLAPKDYIAVTSWISGKYIFYFILLPMPCYYLFAYALYNTHD